MDIPKYPIYRVLVVGERFREGDLISTGNGLTPVTASQVGDRIIAKNPRDIFLRPVGELNADLPGNVAVGWHASV